MQSSSDLVDLVVGWSTQPVDEFTVVRWAWWASRATTIVPYWYHWLDGPKSFTFCGFMCVLSTCFNHRNGMNWDFLGYFLYPNDDHILQKHQWHSGTPTSSHADDYGRLWCTTLDPLTATRGLGSFSIGTRLVQSINAMGWEKTNQLDSSIYSKSLKPKINTAIERTRLLLFNCPPF